jgi:hypothetical protein
VENSEWLSAIKSLGIIVIELLWRLLCAAPKADRILKAEICLQSSGIDDIPASSPAAVSINQNYIRIIFGGLKVKLNLFPALRRNNKGC